jgi:hypothetical protein
MNKLYFSIAELTFSHKAILHGIDNTPDLKSLDNMLNLIFYCLNPIRTRLGLPMKVSSGYRCSKLNEKVGGASNSQHVKGQAVDFIVEEMSAKEVIKFIKNTNIEYDQLIYEKRGAAEWIHISFVKDRNRNQYLEIIQ